MRLAPLLSGAIAQRQVLATGRGLAIVSVLDEAIEVHGDEDLITRVIENILDNALRHAPTGGSVEVRCEAGGSGAMIQIGNSGPAIPVEQRALVFEKFRQASPALGRMNLGLGLYFCRLAIEAQGGAIWIEETERLPAVVAIRLPRVAMSAEGRVAADAVVSRS